MSTGLQSVALDILQTLVRANAGNKENNPRPLSQLLVANAFPAAVKCTLHSDDNSVTQVPHFQSSYLFRTAKFLKLKSLARCVQLWFPKADLNPCQWLR